MHLQWLNTRTLHLVFCQESTDKLSTMSKNMFLFWNFYPNMDVANSENRLKDISTPDFSTPSFNPRPFHSWLFNHGLFHHELFNPMVQKFMVEKFRVEKSGVERFGVEALGLKVRGWDVLKPCMCSISCWFFITHDYLYWFCVFTISKIAFCSPWACPM